MVTCNTTENELGSFAIGSAHTSSKGTINWSFEGGDGGFVNSDERSDDGESRCGRLA